MEFALVARNDQYFHLVLLKVFFRDMVIAKCRPQSGEVFLNQWFGGGIGLSIGLQQNKEIGQGKPIGAAFVDIAFVILQIKVFAFVQMLNDRVKGTLVVDGNAEKDDAFIVRGQSLVSEMDNEGVVEQLAKENTELLDQRRLFFIGDENDSVDVDYVKLAVSHGL